MVACKYNVTNEKWLPDRYFFRLEIALVIHSEDHSVRVVCSELKHLENYTQPNAPGKIGLILIYIWVIYFHGEMFTDNPPTIVEY